MKVGDYVRTEISSLNLQRIGKIKKIISEDFIHTDIGTYDKDNIIKSSPNIIDLIKEHDLLRLYDVEYGEEYIAEVVIDSADMLSVSNYDCDNFLHLVQELMTNEHIKLISIVTSEQFSQMEYRIGE